LAREIRAMPSAVRLREDYSAEELRTLARRSKHVRQSRRLLSLAAVRDGMDRAAAAKIGGMDRQTLRDWVHRFNASGPEGLIDNRTEGPKPRLSEEQLAQFAKIVEAGPEREKDGVVRWRRANSDSIRPGIPTSNLPLTRRVSRMRSHPAPAKAAGKEQLRRASPEISLECYPHSTALIWLIRR